RRAAAMRGHIARRGTGWHVFFDRPRGPDGRRRKSSKGPFSTKKAAQQWLAVQVADMARGSFVEPTRQTLREFLEEWLAGLGTRALRPNTRTGYEQTLRKHVLEHSVASRPLQALGPQDLNKLYGALLAEGLRPRTARYAHMVLRQALRDAV